MWSFNGFYYRGEQWGPVDLLDLFTTLGASNEQRARIQETPDLETPYEAVYRELTMARFGHIPSCTEYSTEDWPCMLGTWEIAPHQHPAGTLALKYSTERRDRYSDFCPCLDPSKPWELVAPEGCPLYSGRDSD